MNIFDAIILGALQGLTEFLPISSSGHLVLGQHYLGLSLPGHFFEVLVHLGTLCSVLLVFQKDILEIIRSINKHHNKIFILAIVIGTIPAIIIGLTLKDSIDALFDNNLSVSLSLMVTGLWLILSKWFTNKEAPINIKNGFIIGFAQAIAIIPGISRSGATIGMGLLLGISPGKAAKFSFLLAIPAIAGAGLLTALDMETVSSAGLSQSSIIAAFFSSFIIGYFALKWLLAMISNGKFHWFGVYCLTIGFFTFLF